MVKTQAQIILILLFSASNGLAMLKKGETQKIVVHNFLSHSYLEERAEKRRRPILGNPIHIYQAHEQQKSSRFTISPSLPPISFSQFISGEDEEKCKRDGVEATEIQDLEKAIQQQDINTIRKLLYPPINTMAEVSPNALSSSGEPIFFLVIKSETELVLTHNLAEIVKLFLRHKKFDLNLTDKKTGLSALSLALKINYPVAQKVAHILLWKCGIKVNTTDIQKLTALDYAEAAAHPNKAILRLLNGLGAKRSKELRVEEIK